MPEQVVRYLTYVFLALLYLFFLRVLRAVWVELREPKAVAPAAVGPAGAPVAESPPTRVTSRRGEGVERLRILEPPARRGEELPLGEELTVGRAPGCGVSLPDDNFVSQLHARIFRRDEGLWLEDLGSTNGTFLNDKKVSGPVVMRRGDQVRVGRTLLEVVR